MLQEKITFREYQLPKIMEKEVAAWKILNHRLDKKAGTVLLQNEKSAIVYTTDYDMLIEFY